MFSIGFTLLLLASLYSVSYFLFLIDHLLHLYTVFHAYSSNINEVFSINPSANVFVFRDLNAIIRTG